MSTLTTLQEMFLLNISSNAGSSQSGDNITQKVFARIADNLKNNGLANWEIAWGPGVYTAMSGTTPDNVIYLARDKTTNRYFLSVAGTNAYSIIDWIEDFDTGGTSQWPYIIGTDVQVANGSLNALNILTALTGQACVNGISTGAPVLLSTYLQQTLGAAAPASFALITGGHSLGGALAPLLALWLNDTKAVWDPNKAVSGIACWPCAGPTAGTKSFQTYYNARVPDTTRIHNTLDVVPHAWNMADLKKIPLLYNPAIGRSDCVDWFVGRCEGKVAGIDYEQAGLTDEALTGTVNTSIVRSLLPAGINFGLQLDYQHVKAYYDLLGLNASMSFLFESSLAERVAYWAGVAASTRVHTRSYTVMA